MRLDKKQREALITWVAEGLESDEINKRAAKFRPRFKVSRRTVTYYRQSRDVKLEEIKDAGESNALKTGFAIRENRVAALQKLAHVMIAELTREQDNLLWTTNAKTVANAAYMYEEFNKAEIDALRGVLDDIAREVGERRPEIEVNNNIDLGSESELYDRLLEKIEKRMAGNATAGAERVLPISDEGGA